MLRNAPKKLAALCLLLTPLAVSAQGFFENPLPDTTVSGLGVISGWHCTAQEVEFFIDEQPVGSAFVGSQRPDASTECNGRADVGYGLLYNFNKLMPGKHEIDIYADGVFVERRAFTSVQSGGKPFLANASRTVELPGFPTLGETAVLAWSQATQNFVVTEIRDTAKDEGDGRPNTPRRMKLDQHNEITNNSFFNHFKVELQKDEQLFIDIKLFDPEVELAIAELCNPDDGEIPPSTIEVSTEEGVFAGWACGSRLTFTALASGLYIFRFDYGRGGQGSFFPARF